MGQSESPGFVRGALRRVGVQVPGVLLASALALVALEIARFTILPAVLIGLLLGMAVAPVAARPSIAPGLALSAREILRLGVALLERDDPSRVLGVADDWILQPEDPWEVRGYVPNVVFSCGAVPEADGSVKIYWGGADSVMCVGSARIDELVDRCLRRGREHAFVPEP